MNSWEDQFSGQRSAFRPIHSGSEPFSGSSGARVQDWPNLGFKATVGQRPLFGQLS